MEDLISPISGFFGLDPEFTFIAFFMIIIMLFMGLLLFIHNRSVDKEYKQIQVEVTEDGSTKTYTKGNYAYDVKRFVRLFKTAKTVPEFKELEIVVDRLIDNVDKIEMMGRSSFNGRLWSGIEDTYKACLATKKYLDMGYTSIDLFRNVLYFEVHYYDAKETNVLGVTRFVRNETQLASKEHYDNIRISKALKNSRIRRATAKINYDVKLNKYGTRKSLADIKDIIEGRA